MPPAQRRPDVSWLPVQLPNVQALLDQGQATRGCRATVRGGHIIVSRVDEAGADPRFRLALLKGDEYGLSLYRRKKPIARSVAVFGSLGAVCDSCLALACVHNPP